MKKNFLFGLLALMLAGAGFGGISMADYVAKIGNGECNTDGTTCYESLNAAISDNKSTDATIFLISSTSEDVIIPKGKITTIDLGNFKITNKESHTITNKGTLTLKNGTIDNLTHKKAAVLNDKDAVIIIDSSNLTRSQESGTSSGNGGNSYYTFQNLGTATIKGNSSITNNGSFSSNITNGYYNGCTDDSPSLTIEGGTFEGGINTIKTDECGTLTIKGGKFSNNGVVLLNWNESIINGGTFTTTSTTKSLIVSAGWNENNGNKVGVGKITIIGGNFNAEGSSIISRNTAYTAGTDGEIKISGGNFKGKELFIGKNKYDVQGGNFAEPVKKEFITTEGKCTVSSDDETYKYTIGNCPKSSIRHDSDAEDLEGTSPDATVTVDGYNVTVTGPINFYNKPQDQGFGNRYGLEIVVPEEFDKTLISDAKLTLNGAHWEDVNVAYSDAKGGFDGHESSIFIYPKLTAENKSNNLTITLDWGDYYGTETYTVTHSNAELKDKIIVKFDTTGGSTIADKEINLPESYSEGTIKVGDVTAPTKDGYIFKNWYVKGDETKTAYDTSSELMTDVELVAEWTPNTYTVKFDANGGAGTMTDQTFTYDVEQALTANAFTRDGYTFNGWKLDSTTYTDKQSVKNLTKENNGSVTLVAQWKSNSSSSSYSGGGGSSRSSSKTTTTDDTKKAEDTAKTDETKSDESKADEAKTSEEAKAAADAQALKDGYSQEFIDAYNFARKNNITTKDTIREADMDAPLTRIAMAKMLSQYAINVLGKTPDTSVVVPTFPDVDAKLDADYNNGVTLAYQLGIMGINVNKYRPFDLVTRAEFGTALSRMLFGLEDGEGNEWYSTHLAKLMEEQIITNNNPNLQELRGYVMIMLMRSAQ